MYIVHVWKLFKINTDIKTTWNRIMLEHNNVEFDYVLKLLFLQNKLRQAKVWSMNINHSVNTHSFHASFNYFSHLFVFSLTTYPCQTLSETLTHRYAWFQWHRFWKCLKVNHAERKSFLHQYLFSFILSFFFLSFFVSLYIAKIMLCWHWVQQ